MRKSRTAKGNSGFIREMSTGAVKQTIPEEVTCMLRPKKQESVIKHLGGQNCRQREQQVQRPCGEHKPGVLEKQQREEGEMQGKEERRRTQERERGWRAFLVAGEGVPSESPTSSSTTGELP